jgi:hypothetical protein
MNNIYLLMRLYEVDDLARAIETLLDDKIRKTLAQNITQETKAKFDSKNTYPQLLKYF